MPRRTNREDRKAAHHRPGRNLSTRAKVARQLEADDHPTTNLPRFSGSRPRKEAADRNRSPYVVCPKGKIGLPRDVAARRLAQYSADRRPTRPVRIYECPHCSTPERPSFHLTSEPRREAG